MLTLDFREPTPWKLSGIENAQQHTPIKPIRVYHVQREHCQESFYLILGGIHRVYFLRKLGLSHVAAIVHRNYDASIFENTEFWLNTFEFESCKQCLDLLTTLKLEYHKLSSKGTCA